MARRPGRGGVVHLGEESSGGVDPVENAIPEPLPPAQTFLWSLDTWLLLDVFSWMSQRHLSMHWEDLHWAGAHEQGHQWSQGRPRTSIREIRK